MSTQSRAFALSCLIAVLLLVPRARRPRRRCAGPHGRDRARGAREGTDGFCTSTVLVRKGGDITYLVRTSPAMKGRKLEIWTDMGSGWKRRTSRDGGGHGTARYDARYRNEPCSG